MEKDKFETRAYELEQYISKLEAKCALLAAEIERLSSLTLRYLFYDIVKEIRMSITRIRYNFSRDRSTQNRLRFKDCKV